MPTTERMEQRVNQTRPTQRTPYRPPVGIPAGRENRRVGLTVSVAFHALLVVLLLVPFTTHVVTPILQGAGGPGPAGGGGGGRGGTGGPTPPSQERLSFIQVAPETPKPAPAVVTPPVQVVPPKPVETPKPVERPAVIEPKPDAAATKAPQPAPDVAATNGTGGGTGTDGTNGSGPGSGGGVGTGVGTGRGSGVGPGTGGGTQANYPPQPREVLLQPMPIPSRLRDFCIVAEFDVDETGRVLDFKFTDTKDGGYNRKLRDVLKETRFRPGSRPDGTPIRMKAQIQYNCPTAVSGTGGAH